MYMYHFIISDFQNVQIFKCDFFFQLGVLQPSQHFKGHVKPVSLHNHTFPG